MFPQPEVPGNWVVEGVDPLGEEFYSVVFSGDTAEQRAREYCEWQSKSAAIAA